MSRDPIKEKACRARYLEKRKADPEWWESERERDRQRYAEDPETKRAQATEWRAAHPEQHMFTDAKRRARKRGLEFDLELSDIVIPEVCPALGIPIFRGYVSETKKTPGPNSPSLDRIDSSKGYLKGNVRVISWKANRIKSDATAEDLEKILAYMKT